MSATSYGWLDPRVPARRAARDPFGWRVLPGRARRAGSARGAIGLSFLASSAPLVELLAGREDAAPGASRACDLRRAATSGSTSAILRPAGGDHGADRDRRLVPDPPVFGGLHVGRSRLPRFFAYLNFFVFSMLLLVLAANFVLLIIGWAFVGAASYLLISFWYRRERPPRPASRRS